MVLPPADPLPPPREEPRRAARRPIPTATVNPADVLPRGGIARGRWHVVIVHHSATAKATPESMHREHLRRGWERGLGYHFVIGNGVNYGDGQLYIGSRWKRQTTGAHCKAGAGRYFGIFRPNNFFNERGIGICLIGNFQQSNPTPRQLATLTALVELLCAEGRISPSAVYGHGQVTNATECPGRHMLGRIADVRRTVAASLALRAPAAPWEQERSRADDHLTAPAYAQLDLAAKRAHGPAETVYAPDVRILDRLDQIAGRDAGGRGWAGVRDFEYDDALRGVTVSAAGACDCGAVHDAHAAPEQGGAAHPADPCDVAPLDFDLGREPQFATLQLDGYTLADVRFAD